MPQTRESIQILRHEKTPFAIALTKIDLLAGWRKTPTPVPLADQIARGRARVRPDTRPAPLLGRGRGRPARILGRPVRPGE